MAIQDLNWRSIAGVVAPLAPKLGGLLGSAFPPFGGIVGAIAGNAIAGALGTQATPAAISEKLAADPGAAARLQQLEEEHADALIQQAQVQIEALKQATEQARIAAEGTANAREFSAQLPAGNAPLAAVQRRLAYLVILSFFGILIMMLVKPDAKLSDAFILVLGVLLGMMKDISQFFFGSSAGSQMKDATNREITTKAIEGLQQSAPAAIAAKEAVRAAVAKARGR